MTTATVVCEHSRLLRPSDRVRRAAEVLAAPIVLTLSDAKIALWATGDGDQPLTTDDLSAPQENVIQLLRPDRLLAAKVGHRQLPLFRTPVDLLQSARADRAARLEPLLRAALETAVEHFKPHDRDTEVSHKKAARLVIGALTTLVLRDKSDLRELSQVELLAEVTKRLGRSFKWTDGLMPADRRLLFALLDELGEWIDYTSLDPAILSEVYEAALVADEERAALGIHYTPPDLARRLLTELPVEIIPPDKRYVVDPACGSGTLLVAAHDRLRALQPSGWSETNRHEDLRVHLRGIDSDPIAAEIAHLALLLHAMPIGNGWKIENTDSLELGDDAWGQPSIIVANPPWRHTRTEGEPREIADRFVAAATRMLCPGGLLALLLPQSWLDTAASAEARDSLRSTCEMFEIWRLPIGTFPTSHGRAIAVMARKHAEHGDRNGGRLLRFIRPGRLRAFTQSGQADETYVLPPDGADGPIVHGPLAVAFEGTDQILDNVAKVLSGPQPLPGIADGSGDTPYLHSFRDAPAYEVLQSDQLWHVRFPDDFQTARGQSLIGARKVLVSAIRSSDGPWCVKSALDPFGVAVRNSMHMVAPRDGSEESMYALFAFTCSGFFNSWVDEHAVSVNIPTRVTRSVPIPFGAEFTTTLAPIGRAIADAASRARASELRAAVQDLEKQVWLGFADKSAVEAICTKRLGGWLAPEGAERYPTAAAPPRLEDLALRRFGYVMRVDGERVQLWVNGITDAEGTWVDTPSRMPGWLLREGATFDVTEYGSGLENGRFVLQANSYEEFDQPEVARPAAPVD